MVDEETNSWITPADVAARLDVTEQQVSRLGRSGVLGPRRQVGGTAKKPRIRYSSLAVERYLASLEVIDLVRASVKEP